MSWCAGVIDKEGLSKHIILDCFYASEILNLFNNCYEWFAVYWGKTRDILVFLYGKNSLVRTAYTQFLNALIVLVEIFLMEFYDGVIAIYIVLDVVEFKKL